MDQRRIKSSSVAQMRMLLVHGSPQILDGVIAGQGLIGLTFRNFPVFLIHFGCRDPREHFAHVTWNTTGLQIVDAAVSS